MLVLVSVLLTVTGSGQSLPEFRLNTFAQVSADDHVKDSLSVLYQDKIYRETDNAPGWVINYNTISNSCQIPLNTQRYQREEYLILPSEMAAGGFLSGFTITNIGFQVGLTGTGTQTGTMKIWLKNSGDMTYTLGSTWTTTGFTLVSSDAAFTVPLSGFYTIPFVNGSSFTYTGGSLYVAWEFVNPSGVTGTSVLRPLASNSLNGLCYLRGSATTQGDTLTASNSRPATIFYGNELRDIAQVTNIYTTERLPVPFGTPVTVTMRASNLSAAPLTMDVILTIRDSATSTLRYTETKTVTIPAYLALRANFTGWTPTLQENVTITVSTSVIPGETVVENNTMTIPANVNDRLFSYQCSRVYPGGAGFFGEGIYATKFFMHGAGHVKGANIAITNSAANIGNTVYAVLMDSAGAIVSQTPYYVLSSGDLGKMVSFTYPVSFPVNNGSFYIGLAVLPGIAGLYHPLAVSDESPIRYNTYYVANSLSGGSLSASSRKHGMEAVVVAQPSVITTDPTAILNDGATLNGTVNPNDEPTIVSFQYGLTTSYGSTISGNPASVSGSIAVNVNALLNGLPYNTLYHYRIVGTSLGGTVYGQDHTFRTGCSSPAGPAGPISGPHVVCGQTAGPTYTVNPVTNATGYLWTIPAGSVISSGAGTNMISLTPGTVSDSIRVTPTSAGSCENGQSSALFVEVLPLPVPTIGSSGIACSGSTGNMYYTESGMTGYLWIVSAGGTIVSGQGTNALNVAWNGAGAQSVSLRYTGSNGCTSQFSVHNLMIDPLPSAAGNIAGTAALCAGTSGIAYSCNPVLNATSYLWTLPAGAVITSGAGTENIIADFGSAASGGIIRVAGNNQCGTGIASPDFNVTVYDIPEVPVISVNGTLLTSSASAGNQWYYEGSPIPGATGQTYTVVHNTGYYSCEVTLNGCPSGISSPVWVVVTGIGDQAAAQISLFPTPNNGLFSVSISNPANGICRIEVYNNAGLRIYQTNNFMVTGSIKKEINLPTVTNGFYTVAIINNRHTIYKKIVISR